MTEVIWTHEMRIVLYSRLHMEFGPHREWNGARYPRDHKARFDEVKDQLAKYLSEMAGRTISAGAVDNQLAFAVTGQRELTNAGFARNFILNAAAALEVGFISSADLPEHIVLRES